MGRQIYDREDGELIEAWDRYEARYYSYPGMTLGLVLWQFREQSSIGPAWFAFPVLSREGLARLSVVVAERS